ncbi:MAG: hypothetical protein ACYTAS_23600 [Planctomycetota bacterium]|jgi:hypothetical protein
MGSCSGWIRSTAPFDYAQGGCASYDQGVCEVHSTALRFAQDDGMKACLQRR